MTTEAWEWAVDVLAEELAATPVPIRQQVLKNLVLRGGYESADAAFDPEAQVRNVRAELVRRLVARMGEIDRRRGGVVLSLVPRDPEPRRILLAGLDAAG